MLTKRGVVSYLCNDQRLIKMMGRILYFLPLILLAFVLKAQNYLNTEPTEKNAIIEMFTGVACSNCPEGHIIVSGILADHPERVFCSFYHPSNSGYTAPYPNDPDLRREYPNAFYSVPYCGSQRFMPGAFINRRIWSNGERIQARELWRQQVDSILAEPSPLNIGMVSNYDCISGYLYVTVEVYYTSDMPDTNHVYVIVNENGLVTQQSGCADPYIHCHTFRKSLCEQWGTTIAGPSLQGQLYTINFSCKFSDQEYVPGNCEIIAFVENASSGEVINGTGIEFGSATYIPPTAGFIADDPFIAVGKEAVFRDVSSGGGILWEWSFEGGVPGQSELSAPPPVRFDFPGKYDVRLIVRNPAGSDTIEKENFISVGYPPRALFSADTTDILAGQSVDFTDRSMMGPGSWHWQFPGGSPAESYEKNPRNIRYDEPGAYDVTLMVSNDYGEDLLKIENYVAVSKLGANEIEPIDGFKVYPNPCNGILHIVSPASDKINRLVIRDMSGKLVYIGQLSDKIMDVELNKLTSGIYIAEIQASGKTYSTKICIR